jgi:DNA-binding NarL/FixJ family response regulator
MTHIQLDSAIEQRGGNIAPLIHIGVVSDSPMRLAGLVSVFDEPLLIGEYLLTPVVCSKEELLAGAKLSYLILDVDEPGGLARAIHAILLVCPGLRMMVFGPQGNYELALQAISAGARGYLDVTSEIERVRQALDVVVGGHIWGTHTLLSKIAGQLLKIGDSGLPVASPQFTAREKQVAELIVAARSNIEVARMLGIGTQTVTAHVGRMMRKTGTVNRIELASFMRKDEHIASEIGLQGTPSEVHAME